MTAYFTNETNSSLQNVLGLKVCFLSFCLLIEMINIYLKLFEIDPNLF